MREHTKSYSLTANMHNVVILNISHCICCWYADIQSILQRPLQHFCSHDCAEVIKSCLHLVRFTSIIPRSSQSSYHISGWEDREQHGRKTEVMKDIHRYLLCSIVNVKKFRVIKFHFSQSLRRRSSRSPWQSVSQSSKSLAKSDWRQHPFGVGHDCPVFGPPKDFVPWWHSFEEVHYFLEAVSFLCGKGKNREGLEIQKYLRLLQVVNFLFHTILTFCTS